MKKPTPLLTSAAVLTTFVLGAWTLHAADTDSTSTGMNPRLQKITRTGTITGWSVVADGTVSIRLEGQHNNRDFKLWFATPANRTATTRYEDLVLEAVLQLSAKSNPETITITSDTSNNESGARPADALPLKGLLQDR